MSELNIFGLTFKSWQQVDKSEWSRISGRYYIAIAWFDYCFGWRFSDNLTELEGEEMQELIAGVDTREPKTIQNIIDQYLIRLDKLILFK